MRSLILILLLACAWAQPSRTTLIPGNPPGGAGAACTNTTVAYLAPTGSIYTCISSVWTAGAGASSPWTRSGTNISPTTATDTVTMSATVLDAVLGMTVASKIAGVLLSSLSGVLYMQSGVPAVAPTCEDVGGSHLNVSSAGVPYCGLSTGSFPSGSLTWSAGTINANTCSSNTFTLLNAAPGDKITPGFPAGLSDNIAPSMRVSAADTVKVVLCNPTGSNVAVAASLVYSAALTK